MSNGYLCRTAARLEMSGSTGPRKRRYFLPTPGESALSVEVTDYSAGHCSGSMPSRRDARTTCTKNIRYRVQRPRLLFARLTGEATVRGSQASRFGSVCGTPVGAPVPESRWDSPRVPETGSTGPVCGSRWVHRTPGNRGLQKSEMTPATAKATACTESAPLASTVN